MKKIALALALALPFVGCDRYQVPNLLEPREERLAREQRQSNETIAMVLGVAVLGAAALVSAGRRNKA